MICIVLGCPVSNIFFVSLYLNEIKTLFQLSFNLKMIVNAGTRKRLKVKTSPTQFLLKNVTHLLYSDTVNYFNKNCQTFIFPFEGVVAGEFTVKVCIVTAVYQLMTI